MYCKQMYEDKILWRHQKVCNENPNKENTPNRKSPTKFENKNVDLGNKTGNKSSKLGRKLFLIISIHFAMLYIVFSI